MSIIEERSILGGVQLDNAAYKQASEHLKPKGFSLDSHRRIYSRLVDLTDSGRIIDPITLAEELHHGWGQWLLWDESCWLQERRKTRSGCYAAVLIEKKFGTGGVV